MTWSLKHLFYCLARASARIFVGVLIGFFVGVFLLSPVLPEGWEDPSVSCMIVLGGTLAALVGRFLLKPVVQGLLIGWMTGLLFGVITARVYAEIKGVHDYGELAVHPVTKVARTFAKRILIERIAEVSVPICGITGSLVGWLVARMLSRRPRADKRDKASGSNSLVPCH